MLFAERAFKSPPFGCHSLQRPPCSWNWPSFYFTRFLLLSLSSLSLSFLRRNRMGIDIEESESSVLIPPRQPRVGGYRQCFFHDLCSCVCLGMCVHVCVCVTPTYYIVKLTEAKTTKISVLFVINFPLSGGTRENPPTTVCSVTARLFEVYSANIYTRRVQNVRRGKANTYIYTFR